MARINRIFKWGFLITVVFMAGYRATPGYDDWFEIVGAGILLIGFLTWAATGYAYAWWLVIKEFTSDPQEKSYQRIEPHLSSPEDRQAK